MGETETSDTAGGNVNDAIALKTIRSFLKWSNIVSYTHEPATALLSIYPDEGETQVYRKIFIHVFTAPLFIRAKKKNLDAHELNG